MRIFLRNALVWPAEGDIYHQLLQPEGSIPQVTTPVCVWGAFNVLQLFKDIYVDGVCRLCDSVLSSCHVTNPAQFTDLYKKFEYDEKVHLCP